MVGAVSRTSHGLSEELQSYVLACSTPLDEIELSLRSATESLDAPVEMLSAVEQGRLLAALVRIGGARLAVEVGTFTGFAALCMARALPPEGRLICCELNEEWVDVGRRHWEWAGIAERVEVRIGPALQTLQAMPTDQRIDLAFVDADKSGYVDYYEEIVPRLAERGVLLADNVLAGGRVVDPDADDDTAVAIRRFNEHVSADPRTEQVMLPVGDGMTVVMKR